MKQGIDIYNFPTKMKAAVRKVENANISEKNKRFIFEFSDYCTVNAISVPRITKYLNWLPSLAEILGKDFDIVTKEDMVKLVRYIQDSDRAAWTKSDYKKMTKRFYKWLKNTEDTYPPEVKWIKANISKTERKLISNSELLTEEDVKKLIDGAEHPRDKALISCLWESGTRVGELATLQIENVCFDEHGVILNVQGKTGSRQVRIISSTPYLVTWMQCHPKKDDRKSPLWINIGTVNHGKPMAYANIRKLLTLLFQKVGIKKRSNAHMWRHARASHMANYLTEFQMNSYFGWVQGSNMPSTYVHMSGKNIDSSILAMNGIEQTKDAKESSLKPIVCSRCSTINANDAKFCNNCANILDTKTAYELQNKLNKEKEVRSDTDKIMNALMKDKEFATMIVTKMKEMGITQI
jgi:integrase